MDLATQKYNLSKEDFLWAYKEPGRIFSNYAIFERSLDCDGNLVFIGASPTPENARSEGILKGEENSWIILVKNLTLKARVKYNDLVSKALLN